MVLEVAVDVVAVDVVASDALPPHPARRTIDAAAAAVVRMVVVRRRMGSPSVGVSCFLDATPPARGCGFPTCGEQAPPCAGGGSPSKNRRANLTGVMRDNIKKVA
jgi:hypothetical protein